MKKNLQWMFAAILSCGMTMTSCSVEDVPGTVKPVITELDLESEDALNAFEVADASKLAASIVEDEETGSKAIQFVRSGSSGFGYATYQFPDMENATKVKVCFDFKIPAEILGQSAIAIGDATVHNAATGGFNTSSGQYGYGVNGAIFYMGAFRGKAYGGGNENYFQINGLPAAASKEEHPAADIWGKWLHADIAIDVEEKLVSYSIMNGNEVWFAADTTFISENAATCTQLSVYIGYSGSYLLDNVTVVKEKMDASIKYADYTVQYVDTEGNPIPEDLKVPVVRRGKVGTAITLLDSDKANMQTADGSVKYIYQSDNSEGAVVTENGTVINVVFKAEDVEKYKYIINGMIDGVSGLDGRLFMFQGEDFVGKSTTHLLPIGCGKDGAYYFVTPKQYNGYDVTITGSEETTSGYILTTVNYVLDPNVVYFGECEDLEHEGELGSPFSQGTFNRISQGKSAQPKIGTSIFTPVIPAGTYDVSLYGRNDKNNTSRTDVLYVKAADGTVTKVEVAPNPETWGNATMGWIVFSGVTIPEGGSLVIKNETETESISYDCIKVVKPAAPAEE